ncbi:MAG: hypothetical protein RLZZ81_818 [Pseudomonadota bacterium]|jgi:ankyrin repeat protein
MKSLWNISWSKYSWAEIWQLLLQYPSLADDYTSPNGWFDSNLLLLAVKSDDTKLFKKVLEIEKINVDELCIEEGWTALHIASARGNLEMVKFLAEEGKANIKARTHHNQTAIDLSSGNLEFKVTVYLRELGEEIPRRPSGGSSIGRKTSENFEKKLKDYDKFEEGFQ